jgi:hypothetical protein
MGRTSRFLGGCAAWLMVVGGAQAADMPVKAKPVQYVKICSLYGDGFYYIPGSDTCLRFGGYVRSDSDYNAGNGGIVLGSGPMAGEGRFTRATNSFNFANRAIVALETRSQTQYGGLRTYSRLRFGQFTPGSSGAAASDFAVERALIQFAGFTFGHAQSFFDIITFTNRYNYLDIRTAGDTQTDGINLAAYTYEFGNGASFSVSAEDAAAHNKAGTLDGSASAFALNGVTVTDNHGIRMPDFTGSLRLEQGWGTIGVSGAIHDVSAAYFQTPNSTINGHPDNKFGWAVSGGVEFRPFATDRFGVNAVYSQGAAGYATKGANWQMYGDNSVGLGWISDGIFDTGKQIELTQVWSVNAAYEHVWSPMWRTSLYGGYVNVSYNDTAKTIINSHLPGAAGTPQCGVPVAGAVWPPVSMTGGGAGNSCTPDFSFYQIGSRTEFNPVAGFGLGLDVFYTRLNTAYRGIGAVGSNAPRPAVQTVDDQNVLSAIFRAQRSLNPSEY